MKRQYIEPVVLLHNLQSEYDILAGSPIITEPTVIIGDGEGPINEVIEAVGDEEAEDDGTLGSL